MVRAVAALTVFVSHAANAGMLPGVFGLGLGQIGVMLFFALSGFLMTALYGGRSFDGATLANFARARIGRVVPLYVVVVLVSVLLTPLLGTLWHYQFDDPGTIASALLFLQAPYELWSIPIEVQYYLVFTGIWLAMASLRQTWIKIALHLALIAASLTGILIARRLDISQGILPFYASLFLIGGLVALLQEDRRLKRCFEGIAGSILGCVAIVLFAINLPGLRADYGLVFGGWLLRTWFDPLNVFVVVLVLLCAVYQVRPFRLLCVTPVIYLGEISYGFYLFHRPIVEFVASPSGLDLDNPVGALLALAVTVALAAVSYRYFERYALAVLRGPRRKDMRTEAAAPIPSLDPGPSDSR